MKKFVLRGCAVGALAATMMFGGSALPGDIGGGGEASAHARCDRQYHTHWHGWHLDHVHHVSSHRVNVSWGPDYTVVVARDQHGNYMSNNCYW